MQYSLMQHIFNFIIENRNEFQLHNATSQKFRAYIYDEAGEFLIGGKQVSDFISDAIVLMHKGASNE